jgi:hypothetical protein
MLNFCSTEYVDTIQLMEPSTVTSREKKPIRLSRKKRFKNIVLKRSVLLKPYKDRDLIDNIVNICVKEILCSEEWNKSNQMEYRRYMNKWTNSMTKVLRDFKRKSPGLLPIIPDVYSRTISSMGNTRVPPDTCIQDRTKLASWCTDNIRHHLLILYSNFPEIIQMSRLRGTVVGLMYLMRCGIIVKGIVVLPKLHMLYNMLPLETHLPTLFGVKGKVITETENTVKQVLKRLSTKELAMYGAAQNKNPLAQTV